MLITLKRFSVAVGLCAMTFVAGGATVQAAAQRTPDPPKQLCIGSKCVATPAAVTGGKVKWHPGHYGASAGIALAGDSISKFLPEMNEMLKDDWIVGYRLFISWAALDHGPVTFTSSVGGATSGKLTAATGDGNYWTAFSDGEYRTVTVKGTAASWSGALQSGAGPSAHLYTTDMVDSVLSRLKSAYNKPKYLVLGLLPMSFAGGSKSAGDDGIVPLYITNSPQYGPSPDPSAYGWWGPPPGATKGTYTAAVYRPSVAARYAELGTALGAKYNSDPNFEGIMDQEDSAVKDNARVFPPSDGTYSDDAYIAAMKSYLTVWLAAFPNTNVIVQNTWLAYPTSTQQFEAWMLANRIAPSGADASGQSFYNAGHAYNSWGQAAYFGLVIPGSTWTGGPDMRGVARAMMDVESGDIGSGTGGKINNTPLDIIIALNQTVKASHAFWSRYMGGTNPPTWALATATLRDNPLTNTGYPGNYPQ